MEEIICEIDERGNVVFEGKGFVGADCIKETAALEAALGNKTSDIKTREFNQTAAQGSTARAGR